MAESGLRNDCHSPTVEVVPLELSPCLCTEGWISGVRRSADRRLKIPRVSGRSLCSWKCDPAYDYARCP